VVELRVKSTEGDEMNMKKKAELLNEIQAEKWRCYEYRDEMVRFIFYVFYHVSYDCWFLFFLGPRLQRHLQ
jgi:hypothetical protein